MGRNPIRKFMVLVMCCAALAAPSMSRAASVGMCEQDANGATIDAPNVYNDPAAPVLVSPVQCHGQLPTSGDTEDWYRLTVARGQHVRAFVTSDSPLAFQPAVEIRDGDGHLHSAFNPAGRGGMYSCADQTISAGGKGYPASNTFIPDACSVRSTTQDASDTWFLGVYHASGNGSYELTVHVTDPEDDCHSGADAPESLPNPNPDGPNLPPPDAVLLSLPYSGGGHRDLLTCSASFDWDKGDTEDFYKVFALKNDVVTATPTWISFGSTGYTQPAAQLFNPDGTQVLGDFSSGWAIPSDGYYYLDISNGGEYGLVAEYSLDVEVSQNDCGSGADADNLALTPSGKDPVKDCTGTLDGYSTEDDHQLPPQVDCPPAPAGSCYEPPADGSDSYDFVASLGSTVTVTFKAPASAANLSSCWSVTLSDNQGTVSSKCAVFGTDAVLTNAAPSGPQVLTITLPATKPPSATGGGYSFHIDGIQVATSTSVGDCGDTKDAGATTATATDESGKLTVDSPTASEFNCSGEVDGTTAGVTDTADLYTFPVSPTTIIQATVTPGDANSHPAVTVLDGAGNDQLATSAKVPAAVAAGQRMWFVKVTAPQDSQYVLRVVLTTDNDCGITRDAGDDQAHADMLVGDLPLTGPSDIGASQSTCLTPTSTLQGAFVADAEMSGPLDRSDWYKVSLPSDTNGVVVMMQPENSSSDFNVCVTQGTRSSGTVATTRCFNNPAGVPEVAIGSACAPAAGVCDRGDNYWYISVISPVTNTVYGGYRLTITGER